MPFGNKDSSSTGSSWFCPFNLNTFLTGEFKSPLVCIHRSWLTNKAASLTFLHPSGMKKLLLFTILRFVSTSQHGWNHKRQTENNEDDCDCFCLFVFYLAPPPHSCQPDCLGVTVYLSIFGFSGCCCLDMNHESFSHSLQELLGASCYGYSTSWFRETPCEINLTSETYLFCLSFTFSTDAVQFSFWWINRF